MPEGPVSPAPAPPTPPPPAAPPLRERLGRGARKRLWVLTAPALAASLAAVLAPLHWVLENAGEFRMQLLAGQVALLAAWAALAGFRGIRWKTAAAPLALLAAASVPHALAIAPLWTAAPPKGASTSRPFRVLSANVHTANDDFGAVVEAIEKEAPDVLVLLEVDSRWRRALAAACSGYPSQAWWPSDGDNFGIAILSRVPGSRARIDHLAPAEPRVAETAHALFEWEGKTVEVIAVHAVPPVSPSYVRGNRAELKALAAHVRGAGHACVLAGDFNRTPWSPAFRRLLRDAGLSHGRAGRGTASSWPRQVPFLRIPIDHVCATSELAIAGFRRLPAGGSDHNPVAAEIAWR